MSHPLTPTNSSHPHPPLATQKPGRRGLEFYFVVSPLSVFASMSISMPAHMSSEDFAVG